MKKTIYIETMGCQMNKLDSELITGELTRQGYQITDDPDQAGVIIYNTCSVRGHAEDKVVSKIGQLGRRHEKGDLVLVIAGCMAQRLGQQLLDNHPQVDVVCSPGQLHRLGEMIHQAQQNKQRQMSLNDPAQIEPLEQLDISRRLHPSKTYFQAYLRVMRGCNKYCSYCVVPYVRGPEQSRPINNIVTEAKKLVDSGVIEITLLGQTVNSYQYADGEKKYGLADVLEKVHEIEGLQRLRFVTSYPRDFDARILQAMADLPKVCPYLHIPAQSGSDKILKAMNRRYTARQYLDIIERARRIVPDITISGDFIVGFCDEDEEDFAATKDLMLQVRYKNCFIFKYSPRPATKAQQRLDDNVPDEIKRRRNTELLELQNKISYADNQQFIGQTVQILVEGPSKKPHLDNSAAVPQKLQHGQSPSYQVKECQTEPERLKYEHSPSCQLVGRTRGDHIVVFNGPTNLAGQIIKPKVNKVSALTLFAEYG